MKIAELADFCLQRYVTNCISRKCSIFPFKLDFSRVQLNTGCADTKSGADFPGCREGVCLHQCQCDMIVKGCKIRSLMFWVFCGLFRNEMWFLTAFLCPLNELSVPNSLSNVEFSQNFLILVEIESTFVSQGSGWVRIIKLTNSGGKKRVWKVDRKRVFH